MLEYFCSAVHWFSPVQDLPALTLVLCSSGHTVLGVGCDLIAFLHKLFSVGQSPSLCAPWMDQTREEWSRQEESREHKQRGGQSLLGVRLGAIPDVCGQVVPVHGMCTSGNKYSPHMDTNTEMIHSNLQQNARMTQNNLKQPQNNSRQHHSCGWA